MAQRSWPFKCFRLHLIFLWVRYLRWVKISSLQGCWWIIEEFRNFLFVFLTLSFFFTDLSWGWFLPLLLSWFQMDVLISWSYLFYVPRSHYHFGCFKPHRGSCHCYCSPWEPCRPPPFKLQLPLLSSVCFLEECQFLADSTRPLFFRAGVDRSWWYSSSGFSRKYCCPHWKVNRNVLGLSVGFGRCVFGLSYWSSVSG